MLAQSAGVINSEPLIVVFPSVILPLIVEDFSFIWGFKYEYPILKLGISRSPTPISYPKVLSSSCVNELALVVNEAMQMAVPDIVNDFESTKNDLDYNEFKTRKKKTQNGS